MSTLSVPLPSALEAFIDEMVRSGAAANKADVVRQALARFAEDQAVEAVLRSEQEVRDGKILRGDIREIIKRLP
jgi:Arc/MetJ-type ribon-helix-helix transcriptional regulator